MRAPQRDWAEGRLGRAYRMPVRRRIGQMKLDLFDGSA